MVCPPRLYHVLSRIPESYTSLRLIEPVRGNKLHCAVAVHKPALSVIASRSDTPVDAIVPLRHLLNTTSDYPPNRALKVPVSPLSQIVGAITDLEGPQSQYSLSSMQQPQSASK
jgi:hypothetical protein